MPRACLECGASLTGPYCAQCGQRDRDPDPTLRELLGEAWDAFASVDGRMFSSLRLLVLRPGVLTAEYLSGRRTRHLAPLRLYLICSVAYFLVASLVPDREGAEPGIRFGEGKDTVQIIGIARAPADGGRRDSTARAVLREHGVAVPAGALDSATRAIADSLKSDDQVSRMRGTPEWFRRRLAHGLRRALRDRQTYGATFKEQLPRLLFVLMPILAVLLALLYRSRRRRYPVHLVVSLHLHSFAFVMLTLGALADAVPWGPASKTLGIPVLVWECAYVPLALRRVYGGRLRWAVARATALGSIYGVIVLLAFSLLGFALLLVY